MELSSEQQKAIDEQKANCPFCKIVKGEIPSKKVYEDDTILVVLDINPAAKGHMLVLPKEHYPIMPLIPKETFKKLFSITQSMCGLCGSALVANGSNVFIANGGAAGQQSQHFMLHVIPRDKDDGLENFSLKYVEQEDEAYNKAAGDIGNNLKIMASKQFGGAAQTTPMQQAMPKEYSDEQIIGIIEANPPLLELVLKQPQEFLKQVPTHPQLSVMFKGKDIEGIVKGVLEKHGAAMPEPAEVPAEAPAEEIVEEKKEEPQSEEKEFDEPEEEDDNLEKEDEEKEEVKDEEEGEADLDDIANLFN